MSCDITTEEPRPAKNADYGRVDFGNEEGATDFTVWAVPTEDGIVLRVQSVGDTPITIETEGDRTIRQAQLTHLHDELAALGEQARDYFSWDKEGDPSEFAPCKFELAFAEPEGDAVYVELTYTGTNPYEGEEAAPPTSSGMPAPASTTGTAPTALATRLSKRH